MELTPRVKHSLYEIIAPIGVDGTGGVWLRGAKTLFLIAFFVNTDMGQTKPPTVPAKSLYFLNDPDERWCAFNRESEWRSEVEMLGALTTAVAKYTGSRISSIDVTTEDNPEAGDWVIFDTYSLGKDQTFQSLKRTINVLPGFTSELETWLIQNGKAIKQSSVSRDLDTLKPKPVQATGIWLPSAPIFTRLSALPFWPLVRDKRQQISSGREACITVKRPPPVPPTPAAPVTSWKTFMDRFGWTIEYPATWNASSSCPVGCKGEGVIFSNPETHGSVIVSSLADELAGRSIEGRLAELKQTNVNPQVSEIPISIDHHPSLTVRYMQPETEMETTYVVTDSAFFQIQVSSTHWKIEQLADYSTYRHMLSSFKFPK